MKRQEFIISLNIMEKKTTNKSYVKPAVNCIQMSSVSMLCQSGGTGAENYNEKEGAQDWKVTNE